MKVVFIAGPFRGETAWDIECNVRRAEELALRVARAGAMPLCPHTNTRFFQGQGSDKFWLEGTKELLRRCDAIIMLEGWENSTGSKGEFEEARKLNMPIFYDLPAVWHGLVEWIGKSK